MKKYCRVGIYAHRAPSNIEGKNHTLRGGVLPGADISAPYKMRCVCTLVRLLCKNNA